MNEKSFVAGFLVGEGCFHIGIRESKSHKTGKQIFLLTKVGNTNRELLELIKDVLDCGRITRSKSRKYNDEYERNPYWNLQIQSLKENVEKVIPLVQNHSPIKTERFKAFEKAGKLVKEGKHLTPDGVRRIRKIKEKLKKSERKNIT